MAALALRPRSSTELVDAAIQVYKREPMSFLVAVALIYVPWLVVRMVFDVGMDRTATPTTSQFIITVIGAIVVYTLVGGVTTIIASDVYLDQPVDVARSFRAVASRLAPLVTTMIIVSVMIVACMPFFLLPALYPIARFFGVRQAILLEDKGSFGALSRSSQLSAKTKRHILNTLLLVFLVTIAISIGLYLVFEMIPNRIARAVLETAVSGLVTPAFGIAETLLYYDIRIRKEGFDVEYLASQTLGSDAALASPSTAG